MTFESFDVALLETNYQIDADMYNHEPDLAYEHIFSHVLYDWGILLVFYVACAS